MTVKSLKPGWKTVKFDEIAQNVAVRVDPSETQTDIYVGLEHLDPETLHLRNWGHPSDVTGQKLAFKKGDVIFGRRRAYQRKLAIADFNGICSAHAMVLRAKPKIIIPDFLPFFLQSDMFMERAIEISVGSLSPTINWNTLKVEEFPLPPLNEQKRITEILLAVDDAKEAWIDTLICLKKLSNVLSVKGFLLHEARKKNPNIPSGWKISAITELAEIDPRIPRGIDDNLDVSFITMEDVSEHGGIKQNGIKKFGDVKKGYTYFGEGDILFAKITPCMENNKGAVTQNLVNNIGMGSTEFFVFRSLKESDREFLYHFTMSRIYRNRAERWMQGSAGQRRVPREFFLKRPIIIPHEHARKALGKIFGLNEKNIKNIMKHIDILQRTRMQIINTIFGNKNSEVTNV